MLVRYILHAVQSSSYATEWSTWGHPHGRPISRQSIHQSTIVNHVVTRPPRFRTRTIITSAELVVFNLVIGESLPRLPGLKVVEVERERLLDGSLPSVLYTHHLYPTLIHMTIDEYYLPIKPRIDGLR